MKPLLFLLGWCFVALGAVGIVVPGLPTVPLMLVALWLFSRSSRRFHDWLYHHPVFGPPLQRWRAHGVIPLKAKITAVATMAASLAYMAFIARVSVGVTLVTALVMLFGAVFIVRQPSRVSAPTEES